MKTITWIFASLMVGTCLTACSDMEEVSKNYTLITFNPETTRATAELDGDSIIWKWRNGDQISVGSVKSQALTGLPDEGSRTATFKLDRFYNDSKLTITYGDGIAAVPVVQTLVDANDRDLVKNGDAATGEAILNTTTGTYELDALNRNARHYFCFSPYSATYGGRWKVKAIRVVSYMGAGYAARFADNSGESLTLNITNGFLMPATKAPANPKVIMVVRGDITGDENGTTIIYTLENPDDGTVLHIAKDYTETIVSPGGKYTLFNTDLDNNGYDYISTVGPLPQ